MSKYIGGFDSTYTSLFLHESWRELIEKPEPGRADVAEIVSRINQYLGCPTDSLVQLPVAEAMVTYKEKRYNVHVLHSLCTCTYVLLFP